jgi:hypothetical protein
MDSPTRRLAALVVSVFALAFIAEADDAPTPACPAIDPPAATAARPLRVFRDPITGRLRPPTREEVERLREAQALEPKTARVFTTVVRPDGTKVVDLGDAFLFSVVAKREPDGSTQYRCVPSRGEPEAVAPQCPEKK